MSVIIPECTSCKNFTNEKENGKFTCTAFPHGIPDDFFWCKVDVRELHECSNNVKFEEIEE